MFLKTLNLTLVIGASYAALMLTTGCSEPRNDSKPPGALANSHNPDVEPQNAVGVKEGTAGVSAASEDHGHKPGSHGGIIVSLGRDSYHVEAIVANSGELQLYTLGADESRVQDVEIQDLVAYVKREGAVDSTSIEVKPRPQSGDAQGKSSLFVAQLPSEMVGQSLDVTVPNIKIGGERFRLGFTTKAAAHGGAIPDKVVAEEERKLYLTPGGLYTEADIKANGNVTASQKFVDFVASHDLSPKVGDKFCPVTLTKANPACSWIVGGKTYQFCCPPCVDEFVTLAKSKPNEVKDPDEYVKRDAKPNTEK